MKRFVLEATYISTLKKDKKLFLIVKEQDKIILEPRKKVYLSLVSSIISQQLSTKVAAVIYGRFLKLYAGKLPTVDMILDTGLEVLRSIGLSNAKASYVKNVCNFFKENNITDAKLSKMEDEAVIDLLTQIKGVGRWTVEMILMFTLAREDVFAADDLAIQQSMAKIYDLEMANKKQFLTEIKSIAEKWKPYRTYACRHLWGWKDGV